MMDRTDNRSRQLAAALGRAYIVGERLPVDYVKARDHLESAAAAFDPESMAMLGFMLLLGLGGQVDEQRGYEWISAAAEMGEPGAHFGMAARYGQGIGVSADPARSLAHYLVASRILGAWPGVEERLRGELTQQQAIKAECLAAEWAPTRQ